MGDDVEHGGELLHAAAELEPVAVLGGEQLGQVGAHGAGGGGLGGSKGPVLGTRVDHL